MTTKLFSLLSAALTVMFLSASGAYAEKPEKGEKGQGNSHASKHREFKDDSQRKSQKHGNDRNDRDERKRLDSGRETLSFGFGTEDIRTVRNYYGAAAEKGKCPPGLAKKGNGCQPPGLAKQWSKGRALGGDVRFYDIPDDLRARLPIPPIDHRYVQVGSDLLLIAAGSRVVVDAIDGIF